MVQRAVVNYLKRILALDDTPERIALAFAVGIFLAFSPLLGLHTFLAFTVAFLFGLNRVALLVGVFVNNPWTLVPIYAAGNYVGGLLIGFPELSSVSHWHWNEMLHLSFWLGLVHNWRILIPMIVGSSILSLVLAVLSYPVVLFVVRQARAQSQIDQSR